MLPPIIMNRNPPDDRHRGPDTSPPFSLKANTTVGARYRIGWLLGHGGFSAVYKAYDLWEERPVAFKLMHHGSHPDDRLRERFEQEARAIAQLEHPHISAIYDFGFLPASDLPYIVMEVLEGHELFEELNEHGPLEVSRAIARTLELLDAVQHAHDAGVVHKDLTPTNLFLTYPGKPNEQLKVIDFGTARIDDSPSLTHLGALSGTPRYMAPEYIRYQIVMPTVDIYQVALNFVEMLMGSPVVPYMDETECFDAHMAGVLSRICPVFLRTPLGAVVSRALAFRYEQRTQSALGFAQQLQSLTSYDLPVCCARGECHFLSSRPINHDDRTLRTFPHVAAPSPSLLAKPLAWINSDHHHKKKRKRRKS